MKTKIRTEVAHVTRDSYTTFKVKRSKFNLQGAGHISAASSTACYAPALIGWGIKRCFCLTSLCLSRTWGLSREQRGVGRPKLAQMRPTSHVTRTPLSRSKGQRSKTPGRFTHRRVGASGSCSGGRGNVLAMRNCCYVAVCSAARITSATSGMKRGVGISWQPPTYSLLNMQNVNTNPYVFFRCFKKVSEVCTFHHIAG